MNIYLAGMIGAGKTTIGKILAAKLGWAFADFDAVMAEMAGKDFRQVVAEEGWLGFRQREYAICKRFARADETVCALGGGTVRYEWNRDVLAGTGVRVLLVADLDTLAARVRLNDRPRVNPGVTLEQDLAQIWGQHQDLYTNFADVIYDTAQNKTPDQEADELIGLLDLD